MRERALVSAAAVVTLLLVFAIRSPLEAAAEYWLPYPAGDSYRLTQGNHGTKSHHQQVDGGRGTYAFDFGLPRGSVVVAARAGTILTVQEGYGDGGCAPQYANAANYVMVDHGDGTTALYLHLLQGSVSEFGATSPGTSIAVGQPLGRAGLSGYTCGQHLHFQVQDTPTSGRWYTQSRPITFNDPSVQTNGEAGIPVEGREYLSANRAPVTADNFEVSHRLTISPADSHGVGDRLIATFAIRNKSSFDLLLDEIVAGGRRGGVEDCSNYNGCPDFTSRKGVSLAPGASYEYRGEFTPSRAGSFEFQPFVRVGEIWHWNLSVADGRGVSTVVIEVTPGASAVLAPTAASTPPERTTTQQPGPSPSPEGTATSTPAPAPTPLLSLAVNDPVDYPGVSGADIVRAAIHRDGSVIRFELETAGHVGDGIGPDMTAVYSFLVNQSGPFEASGGTVDCIVAFQITPDERQANGFTAGECGPMLYPSPIVDDNVVTIDLDPNNFSMSNDFFWMLSVTVRSADYSVVVHDETTLARGTIRYP